MSLRDWVIQQFTRTELEDMQEYGMDGGWSDLTYYSDTSDLMRKHEREVYDLVSDNCSGFVGGVFTKAGSWDGFVQYLVWEAVRILVDDILQTEDYREDAEDEYE